MPMEQAAVGDEEKVVRGSPRAMEDDKRDRQEPEQGVWMGVGGVRRVCGCATSVWAS